MPNLYRTITKYYLLVSILFFSCNKDFEQQPVNQKEGSGLKTSARQPNIILFLGDDMGYEIPQFTGGRSYETPALNFMAYNGKQFTDFYSHPDGFPSRLAMMTGKYSFRNYINWGILPPQEKTIGNLLEDAGYATCFVGKWQMEGGDQGIRKAGFQKYLVFLPDDKDLPGDDQRFRRYKSPYLYSNGSYLPVSATKNKYSEDMFFDYATNFLESNKDKPFCIIFSHNLVGRPFVPTPDDPDYAAWNPNDDVRRENKKYFPGMVAYMDKIIGKMIEKVNMEGVAKRTLIMFTADNATTKVITTSYDSIISTPNGDIRKETIVRGGKNNVNKSGIHVPFVVYWPGTVQPQDRDSSIINFTDFMPTFADLANVPSPQNYGELDGKTFYDDLRGVNGA